MNTVTTDSPATPTVTPSSIGDFLDARRVVIDLEVSSRKRLFEQMAKLLSGDDGDGNDRDGDGGNDRDSNSEPAPAKAGDDEKKNREPDLETVLHTLTKREKLGCTGIGNGIALPHGRIADLSAPRIAVARLKDAIPYEAADDQPVWLAVCILVPQEADETHLKLLAQLAGGFSTPGFTDKLKDASDAAQLAAHLKNIPAAE